MLYTRLGLELTTLRPRVASPLTEPASRPCPINFYWEPSIYTYVFIQPRTECLLYTPMFIQQYLFGA